MNKFSILTPSFNSGKYLERAIQSVLDQNYTNWEHIVMDGGSTDNTIEVLNKYPHIIWKSEKDKGQSDAMNKAFDLATGDIIVYLNADDEFKPNVFLQIVEEFNSIEARENRLIIADLEIVNAQQQSYIAKPSDKIDDILNPYKLQFPYNPVSYFYDKDLQKQIGKFPSNFHYAMDYWFLLRIYSKAVVKHIDLVAGVFHNYDNKTSDTEKSENEVLDILIHFLRVKNPFTFFLHPYWLKAIKKRYRL